MKTQKNGTRTRKFTPTLEILLAPTDKEIDRLEAESSQVLQEQPPQSYEERFFDWVGQMNGHDLSDSDDPFMYEQPRFRRDSFDPFFDFDDYDGYLYDPGYRYEFDDRDVDDGHDDFRGNHLPTERQDVFDGYCDVEFSYFSYFDFDFDYETNLLRSIPLKGLTSKAKRELIAYYC